MQNLRANQRTVENHRGCFQQSDRHARAVSGKGHRDAAAIRLSALRRRKHPTQYLGQLIASRCYRSNSASGGTWGQGQESGRDHSPAKGCARDRRRIGRWMQVLTSTTLLLLASSIFAQAASPDSCPPPNFPLPQFKSASFNVRDFGATGNGEVNDTAAINRAIEKCSAAGGGDVVFLAGTYLAASIHLQSNVRFRLDKDAVISGAKNGYDLPEPNQFEKYQDFGHSHFHNALMWGEKIENFAIVGGRINGGHIIEGDDQQGRDIGDKVIAIKSSRNLLFDGATHESGGHIVYLLNDCENITLSNIVIKKSRDAVNLVSCRNVQMHDCNFTGCGDDTVALKSDYALGRKITSANIYVWNCYLETAANALMFGAETVGNFHNVNFCNIRIGLAAKSGIGIRSADGSVIDGVSYRDISMKGASV